MSSAAQDFIAGLPKAELHLHIEGTLEPEMAFALAERNGVKLPYASVEAMRRLYDFQNLADFLDLYYQATQALLTERDFYDLAQAYLARAREESVHHAEIFFDPQAHMRRGVPFGAVMEGLSAALNDAAREGGPTSLVSRGSARSRRGGRCRHARSGASLAGSHHRGRTGFRGSRKSAGQVH